MLYEVKLKVNIFKEWASIKDFANEIEDFNNANRNLIEATIEEIKEIENT